MTDNLQAELLKQSSGKNNRSLELPPLRKKKIMVIDDDQDFRLSLCELLVEEGFLVSTAKDGDSGLKSLMFLSDLPDLILLDLMMPVKSGLEFRKEQLSTYELSHIPVVFMSGMGFLEGETCLAKPFDDKELLGRLNRELYHRK